MTDTLHKFHSSSVRMFTPTMEAGVGTDEAEIPTVLYVAGGAADAVLHAGDEIVHPEPRMRLAVHSLVYPCDAIYLSVLQPMKPVRGCQAFVAWSIEVPTQLKRITAHHRDPSTGAWGSRAVDTTQLPDGMDDALTEEVTVLLARPLADNEAIGRAKARAFVNAHQDEYGFYVAWRTSGTYLRLAASRDR